MFFFLKFSISASHPIFQSRSNKLLNEIFGPLFGFGAKLPKDVFYTHFFPLSDVEVVIVYFFFSSLFFFGKIASMIFMT